MVQDRSQALSDASRRKERDVAQRDVDRLRSSIQALTRNVNPLGKILDFLQEDVDAMQKELMIWRHESHENGVALQREEKYVFFWLLSCHSEPTWKQLGPLPRDSVREDKMWFCHHHHFNGHFSGESGSVFFWVDLIKWVSNVRPQKVPLISMKFGMYVEVDE